MKKRLGYYKIDFERLSKSSRKKGDEIYCTAQLKGTIEIGIDMDTHTWRGDWLKEALLGKKADEYELVSVNNNYISMGSQEEINRVYAYFKRRRPTCW